MFYKIIILILVSQTSTKYLFPEHAKIFSNSLYHTDSYFGFFVQLYSSARGNASVIVGSPKASDIYNQNLEKPGAIFRCSLDSGRCEQYNFDSNRDESFLQGKHHSFLGFSLDIDSTTGKLLACAPRWTNNYIKNHPYPKMHGMCYTSNTNSDYLNISSFGDESLQYHLRSYNYIFAEGGFASSLIKDDTIIYTALGLRNWTGSIVQHNKNLDPVIVTPKNIRTLETYSYFGYSLSYGNFNTSDLNKIFYVTGAPRSENLTGRVYVYEQLKDFHTFTVRYEFPGKQFGEYFGASLTVADFNGDGVQDIIIGAPMHSTDHGEEVGCIYPYITSKTEGKIKFKKLKEVIGTITMQRFGTAISSLGDINKDGCDDIAIGAPYHNGIGAVYIYLGQKQNALKFNQIITASEIHPHLRGFGFSLSRGTDIDNNESNDLAIGSYLSGHVVVVKSKPIVDVQIKLGATINEIGLTTKTFQLSSGVQYTTKQNLPNSMIMEIQVISDKPSISFTNKNMKSYTSQLNYTKNTFHNEIITILIDEKLSSDVKFTLNYQIYQGNENFCALCPIEDKMKKPITLKIPFTNGCKNSLACEPNLKLFTSVEEKEIMIGSETELKVKIQNTGENAFDVKLYIYFIPVEISIDFTEKFCIVSEDNITCDFDKPLLADNQWEYIFKLKTGNIPLHNKLINITSVVTSKGNGEYVSDNAFLEVPLKTDLNYNIVPTSNPEQILISANMTNHHITHTFIIENTGITKLESLYTYLSIPVQYNNEIIASNIEVDGCSILNEEIYDAKYKTADKELENIINLNCASTQTENIQCQIIKCEIRDDFPKLEIQYDLNITMFLNEEKGIYLITSLETDLQYLNIQSNTITKLIATPKSGSITLYIVIGTIVGLLLILIIIFVLYKCGFFKRKRPPHFEETKLLEEKENPENESNVENKDDDVTKINIIKNDSE